MRRSAGGLSSALIYVPVSYSRVGTVYFLMAEENLRKRLRLP